VCKRKMNNCLYCNKELKIREGRKRLNSKRKYCNQTCSTRYTAKKYHLKHKDEQGYKDKQKIKFKEWYKNNKQRQSENVLRYYYKHKDICASRNNTNKVLNCKKKVPKIDRLCKLCGSKKDISLKFEIYPIKAKGIREAIKNKKIYYICKKCRFK